MSVNRASTASHMETERNRWVYRIGRQNKLKRKASERLKLKRKDVKETTTRNCNNDSTLKEKYCL